MTDQAITKASEEALRDEDKALVRLLFEQSVVGVCVLDLDGRVVRANAACCRLSGYSQSELYGKHWMELTHPSDIQTELPRLASLRQGAVETSNWRKRFLDRQSEAIPTEVVASVVRDAQGAPLRFLTIVVDLREAKRAEMELRTGASELRPQSPLDELRHGPKTAP